MSGIFEDKAFDVEHALCMYATSFVTIPASSIYDDELIEPIIEQIEKCHIYVIGLIQKLVFLGCKQENHDLITSLEVRGKQYDLRWPLPAGVILKGNDQDGWHVEDATGAKFFPSEYTIGHRLSVQHDAIDFRVLYIGQAFGDNGSRNALDRLKKHETLQKIAVTGLPKGYDLTILMLAIMPTTKVITVFNPRAQDQSQGSERIKNGLDKLFNTTEAERTTLYEAALIRYFQPKFNKMLKNSFPSTNLKMLKDCYDKDFSALVAEICIDELPYKLFSDVVEHKVYHIAKHDLHTEDARRVFFT